MVRVRLKGVNFATKCLADGTLRKYWYAWRGGPLLRGEPGTPEFVPSYNAAVATKAAAPQVCRAIRRARISVGSPTARGAATFP